VFEGVDHSGSEAATLDGAEFCDWFLAHRLEAEAPKAE
jgi:hypothetical protein